VTTLPIRNTAPSRCSLANPPLEIEVYFGEGRYGDDAMPAPPQLGPAGVELPDAKFPSSVLPPSLRIRYDKAVRHTRAHLRNRVLTQCCNTERADWAKGVCLAFEAVCLRGEMAAAGGKSAEQVC
jgi:hypothetical protein